MQSSVLIIGVSFIHRQIDYLPGCGLLYTADRGVSYIPRDQILGAAVGGIPLRTATSSPWMVAVGEQQENGSIDWYCGGSLLQADTVLTAAHCCTRR